MADVLLRLSEAVQGENGTAYVAQICGRAADDGRWEGWIELLPVGGGAAVRSARESQQSNRAELEYWATGLTPVYVEGALARALAPTAVMLEPERRSVYDTPADRPAAAWGAATTPRAVLDPFAVYAQGEDVLRQELGALGRSHLANVIAAYGLALDSGHTIAAESDGALAERIIAAVRRRSTVSAARPAAQDSTDSPAP